MSIETLNITVFQIQSTNFNLFLQVLYVLVSKQMSALTGNLKMATCNYSAKLQTQHRLGKHCKRLM